jgi:hypothetical protein
MTGTIVRKGRLALAAALSAVVVVGLLVGMTSASSATHLDASGSAHTAKLHAAIELTSASPQSRGEFGFATAVANGYVAVGAEQEAASGDPDAGNVYVFNASTGQFVASLTSPYPKLDGFYGWAVAMSGTTLVVGAPNESAGGSVLNAGNAYLYTVSDGTVSFKCTLVDPTPLAGTPSSIGGAFGYSVAISGTNVLVGAPGENSAGYPQGGNAYVFSTGCAWISSLTTPNPRDSGVFGWAVALRGTTAYIAAPEEGSGGHVYIVQKATSPADDQTTYVLSSPNAQPFSGFFGYSLAVAGSVLAVGAARENVSGLTASGNAYVYNANTGVLTTQLTNPTPQLFGAFGYSVAVTGVEVVVGSPFADAFGSVEAGNATVFNATDGAIVTQLTSPNFQNSGDYGESVAADSTCFVVGAVGESVGGEFGAGHAYVY